MKNSKVIVSCKNIIPSSLSSNTTKYLRFLRKSSTKIIPTGNFCLIDIHGNQKNQLFARSTRNIEINNNLKTYGSQFKTAKQSIALPKISNLSKISSNYS